MSAPSASTLSAYDDELCPRWQDDVESAPPTYKAHHFTRSASCWMKAASFFDYAEKIASPTPNQGLRQSRCDEFVEESVEGLYQRGIGLSMIIRQHAGPAEFMSEKLMERCAEFDALKSAFNLNYKSLFNVVEQSQWALFFDHMQCTFTLLRSKSSQIHSDSDIFGKVMSTLVEQANTCSGYASSAPPELLLPSVVEHLFKAKKHYKALFVFERDLPMRLTLYSEMLEEKMRSSKDPNRNSIKQQLHKELTYKYGFNPTCTMMFFNDSHAQYKDRDAIWAMRIDWLRSKIPTYLQADHIHDHPELQSFFLKVAHHNIRLIADKISKIVERTKPGALDIRVSHTDLTNLINTAKQLQTLNDSSISDNTEILGMNPSDNAWSTLVEFLHKLSRSISRLSLAKHIQRDPSKRITKLKVVDGKPSKIHNSTPTPTRSPSSERKFMNKITERSPSPDRESPRRIPRRSPSPDRSSPSRKPGIRVTESDPLRWGAERMKKDFAKMTCREREARIEHVYMSGSLNILVH